MNTYFVLKLNQTRLLDEKCASMKLLINQVLGLELCLFPLQMSSFQLPQDYTSCAPTIQPKYKAYIISLKVTIDLGIDELEVYEDSTLVTFQATEDWFIQEEKFLDYHECLQILSKIFEYLTFNYIGIRRNSFTDALAT